MAVAGVDDLAVLGKVAALAGLAADRAQSLDAELDAPAFGPRVDAVGA